MAQEKGMQKQDGHGKAESDHAQMHAMTMGDISSEMEHCIKECLECSTICRDMVTYCLQKGGEHARPEHIWLMLDCAEICQTSAHFMLHDSPVHRESCRTSADACKLCAEDCERMKDDKMMQVCADACRRCAESCAQMAGMA